MSIWTQIPSNVLPPPSSAKIELSFKKWNKSTNSRVKPVDVDDFVMGMRMCSVIGDNSATICTIVWQTQIQFLWFFWFHYKLSDLYTVSGSFLQYWLMLLWLLLYCAVYEHTLYYTPTWLLKVCMAWRLHYYSSRNLCELQKSVELSLVAWTLLPVQQKLLPWWAHSAAGKTGQHTTYHTNENLIWLKHFKIQKIP